MSKVWVIATFNCGCKHETNPVQTHYIKCDNYVQLTDTAHKLSKHAAVFQCEAAAATNVISTSEFTTHSRLQSEFYSANYSQFLRDWYKLDADLKEREADSQLSIEEFAAKYDLKDDDSELL